MESQLPGIKVFIACKKEAMYLLNGEERIVNRDEIKKEDFAYIRELACNMESHPVENLMLESKLPCGPIVTNQDIETNKCVLLTNGIYPTRSLSGKQIQEALKMIQKQGRTAEINADVSDAGWVIGVENEELFKAAADGKRVTLIATGLGTSLFQAMFPTAQILQLPE